MFENDHRLESWQSANKFEYTVSQKWATFAMVPAMYIGRYQLDRNGVDDVTLLLNASLRYAT